MMEQTTALVVREDELAIQISTRCKLLYGMNISVDQAKAMNRWLEKVNEALTTLAEQLTETFNDIASKLGTALGCSFESLADALSSIYEAIEVEEGKHTAHHHKNDFRAVSGGYRAQYAKCNPNYRNRVIHNTRYYRRG